MFILFRITNKIRCVCFALLFGKFFGSFGKRVSILSPSGIEGISNIFIGNDVHIRNGALLAAVKGLDSKNTVILKISEGCSFGKNNHIYAMGSIHIGCGVLTANNVYISDNTHDYKDIELPIKVQDVSLLDPVSIGDGSWLGQNVCVIGASIGRGCVIGANAVVLSDIPDYSVAVGSPAKVVRQFDPDSDSWLRVGMSDFDSSSGANRTGDGK